MVEILVRRVETIVRMVKILVQMVKTFVRRVGILVRRVKILVRRVRILVRRVRILMRRVGALIKVFTVILTLKNLLFNSILPLLKGRIKFLLYPPFAVLRGKCLRHGYGFSAYSRAYRKIRSVNQSECDPKSRPDLPSKVSGQLFWSPRHFALLSAKTAIHLLGGCFCWCILNQSGRNCDLLYNLIFL
jgi:hypothetical protein